MKTPIKIVIGGAGSVGKTTLCKRLKGVLDTQNLPSMTPGIEIHQIATDEKEENFMIMWDMGGQEIFRFIQDSYVLGAKIVILVFSLEFYHSFEDLASWLKLIPKNIPPERLFLIGNKLDSPRSNISRDIIDEFLEKHTMKYYEVSALKGDGIPQFKKDLRETVLQYISSKEFKIECSKFCKVTNSATD
ncbi:MAG: Rab family GTPase [Promethearchaeota archaeon]